MSYFRAVHVVSRTVTVGVHYYLCCSSFKFNDNPPIHITVRAGQCEHQPAPIHITVRAGQCELQPAPIHITVRAGQCELEPAPIHITVRAGQCELPAHREI